MRILRTLGRLAGLIPVTVAFYVSLLVSIPARRLLLLDRAAETDLAWRAAFLHRWSRCVTWLLGVRFQVEGTLPSAPFLMVSNHLGYIDIVVLASRMRCVFVSKSEVADWPVMGALVRSVGTIFIDRENRRQLPALVDRVGSTLGLGTGVVFFPEGTSGDGSGVLPFRPALLEPAARSGSPVFWAVISYETPPGAPEARESVCWWREMPFVGHFLALLGLPEIRARLVFGKEPVLENDRKLLAARLEQAVRETFVPVDSSKSGESREFREDLPPPAWAIQSAARGMAEVQAWKERQR